PATPSTTRRPPPPFPLHCSAAHRHLHSFPTRRSSDLRRRASASSASSAGATAPSCPPTSTTTATTSASSRITSAAPFVSVRATRDRKSTRLNSSHDQISYAVFCLKKKTTKSPVDSQSL